MTRRSKRKESEPGADGAAAADAAAPAPKKAKAKAKDKENENEKEEKKGYTGGNQNDQHDWGPVDSNLLWRLVMIAWGTAMPQSYGGTNTRDVILEEIKTLMRRAFGVLSRNA